MARKPQAYVLLSFFSCVSWADESFAKKIFTEGNKGNKGCCNLF